jgi:predicted TIM-barrel fold metal-dependent hydrolase
LTATLPEKIIDFHVHLFPDRLFDAIWDHFKDAYRWDVIHRLYVRDAVPYLRERGVGPIVYSNYAHKEGVAEGLNRWNVKTLDQFPDLYCFCSYHPGDDTALDMARSVISHPHVLGFKLQLLVQNFPPDDPRLFPLYELVIQEKKRILFHVGTGPVGNESVGIKKFARLLKRYPDLPASVAHMGGFEFREFLELTHEHPNLFFDTAFAFLTKLDFICDIPPEELLDYSGRIVYGSDFPNLIFPREDEVEYLLSLDLPQDFYDRVFWENGINLIESHTNTSEDE